MGTDGGVVGTGSGIYSPKKTGRKQELQAETDVSPAGMGRYLLRGTNRHPVEGAGERIGGSEQHPSVFQRMGTGRVVFQVDKAGRADKR